MRPTPTERDRLPIFTAAEPARARRARDVRLDIPEATALIADGVAPGRLASLRSPASPEPPPRLPTS